MLGTPSPAVTPTNLLDNVIATPGAIYRYRRQGQTGGRLTRVLLAGTLPGVVAGSVIRVDLLPGAHVFDLVAGAVLAPLGTWIALSRPQPQARPATSGRTIATPVLVVLSAAVGCAGRHLRDRRRIDPRADPGRQLIRRVMGILVLAIGIRYL